MVYKLILIRLFVSLVLVSRTCSELKYNNLNDKLAIELFKAMPETNLVASTLALRLPLCKLTKVATGEARKELMTVLGYPDERWLNSCYTGVKEILDALMKMDMTYVNKIYLNYTDDIDPDFMTNSEYKSGVAVNKVGFNYPHAAVQYINHWVGAATYQRVKDVVDINDVDKNTTMIIVNAIHFKGSWEFPFNYKLTKRHNFHYSNGKATMVQMMTKIDTLLYVDAGEFQGIRIKFGSYGTSMTFLLPYDRKGLPSLINKAYDDPNYLTPFLNIMKPTNLAVKLPRFQIKSFVDWTGFLEEMGLYEIFNCSTPSLLGMLKKEFRANKTMCLNKAKQKVFIQVDEMGAGRHMLNNHGGRWPDMEADGMQASATDVVFDRPFYFTVNLEFSPTQRQELFNGVYYGPEQNN